MKKTAFSLLIAAVLLVSASLAEKPAATREYFENLDKETRLEDIVEDLGPYGVKGSGILYHCWHLEDGSEARVIFDSQGRIAMIYINGENAVKEFTNDCICSPNQVWKHPIFRNRISAKPSQR